jgi:hypothetical protein
MRIPIALTSSTVRVREARVISWKSACARLWYHQSRPAKQMTGAGCAFDRAAVDSICVSLTAVMYIRVPRSRQSSLVRLAGQVGRPTGEREGGSGTPGDIAG